MSIVGPRGKGKSYFAITFLNWLIQEKYFEHIYILSPSLNFNHDYDEFMTIQNAHDSQLTEEKRYLKKHVKVYDQFDRAFVMELMLNQMKCKRAVNSQERLRSQLDGNHLKNKKTNDDYKFRVLLDAHTEDKTCPHALLLMDDCIDNEILRPGGPVDVIAARGRHFNLSMMYMTQKLKSVSNLLRENAEYMLFFRTNLYTEMEKIIEENVSRDDRKFIRTELKRVFQLKHTFVFLDRNQDRQEDIILYGKTQDFEHDRMKSLLDVASHRDRLLEEDENDQESD